MIISVFKSVAQEEIPNSIPFLDTEIPCQSIAIQTISVIYGEEKNVIYLKFEDAIPERYILLGDDGRETNEEICIESETEMIIHYSTENENLSLVAPNSCGNLEIISAINTRKVTDIGKPSISVSPDLNNLLQQWAYQDKLSLVDYLNQDETISIYEKVAFYQEYALGNAPIAENGRFKFDNYSENEVSNGDDLVSDECFKPKLPRDTIVVPADPSDDPIECHCEVLTINPNHLTDYPHVGD